MAWADGVAGQQVLRVDPAADTFAPSDTAAAIFRFIVQKGEGWEMDDAVGGRFVHGASASDDFSSVLADAVGGQFIHRGELSEDFSSSLGDLPVHSLLDVSPATPLYYSEIADSFIPTDDILARFIYRASFGTPGDPFFASDVLGQLVYRAEISSDFSSTLGDLSVHSLLGEGVLSYSFGDIVPITEGTLNLLGSYEGQFGDDFSSTLADLPVHSLVNLGPATPLSYSDIADTVSISDTISALMNYRADAISDTLNITDDIAGRFPYCAQISDDSSSTIIDVADVLSRHFAEIADDTSSSVADGVNGLSRYLVQFNDDVSSTLADFLDLQKVDVGIAYPLSYSDIADLFSPSDSAEGLFKYLASELGDIDIPVDEVNDLAPIPVEFGDSNVPTDVAVLTMPFLLSITDAQIWQDEMVGLQSYLAGLADEVIPLDGIEALLKLFFSTGENIVFADDLEIRGWGITADKLSTILRLHGSDIRPVKLHGSDIRPVKLHGSDIRPVKLTGG